MIEVGEYVKTDYGEIHKVIKVIEDDGDMNYYQYENNMGDFQISIVKHSKDLINLIEVGDCIEYKELRIFTEKLGTRFRENYITGVHDDEELRNIKEEILNKRIKLLSVLTHQDFETNCYKVGGKYNEFKRSD